MKGTAIEQLLLIKVIDGDTIKVEIEGEKESLRLICLDTEESHGGGYKPATNAGMLASKWAKKWFGVNEDGFPENEIYVDIEFDTSEPLAQCLERQRGNYGRLICYVHKDGENFNLKVINEGWSPYFIKYGQSRLYNDAFLSAETTAQAENLGIWNKSINAGGEKRDYDKLLAWWHMRGHLVKDFRDRGIQAGVKCVRLDYSGIVDACRTNSHITVFCDLQAGIQRWPGDGAVIFAGSPTHKFNLWVPDRFSSSGVRLLRFIEERYAGFGRGYLYISGKAELYNEKPQMVLESFEQISDLPPLQL